MESFVWEAVKAFLPVLSVFASYFLGLRQSDRKQSQERAMQRYNSFYVPLFQMLYAGRLWEHNGIPPRLDAREKLLDMFSHNISHLDYGLQSCYSDLLSAHVAMLEFEAGNPDFKTAPSDYIRIFKRIEKLAIVEAKELSKLLHLPSIAQSYEKHLAACRKSRPKQAPVKPLSRS